MYLSALELILMKKLLKLIKEVHKNKFILNSFTIIRIFIVLKRVTY